MTDTYLENNITNLERLFMKANAQQKAQLDARLRALLTPRVPSLRVVATSDDEDDLFDNMPV